jgi:hypothetical protein
MGVDGPTKTGAGGPGEDGDMSDGPKRVIIDEDGFVLVDAHILATPVIADLDSDSAPELLVAVSYYFDGDEYAPLDPNTEPSYAPGEIR